MATAPTVQNLDAIVAELQPSVQGQTDNINAQKAANAAIYDAQRTALEAEKVEGFNQINNQATGRGMAFSGIPLNEQAVYLATKYLPGIQQSNAQQNADALAYDREIADLNANVFNKAFDTRTGQVKDLNSWNQMLSGQEFTTSERIASQGWQAEQDRIQREFTSSESQKDRDFQAAQGAANRAASAAAASAGSGGSSGISGSQLSSWASSYVKGKTGGDGKISPSSYYSGFSDFYTQTGLGQDEYQAVMSKYVNTSHSQDYKLF